MKKQIKKLGFVPPVIDNTHWVLGGGAIPHDFLQPNGNWKDTRPEGEYQELRGIETYDCTGFNTLNAIEQLIFKKYGERYNFSDRWLGIIAGTKYPGNDPHTVAEAIRKYGLIPEEMLPFGENIQNIQEYYSFKGADEEACRAEGKKWLEKWDFRHEWVFNPGMNIPLDEKINNMKVALRRSPLGVSVYAWSRNQQGLYERLGVDTHWTDNDGFNGNNALIFDSYEPFEKELVDDFNFYYVKLYYINKKPTPEEATIQNQTLLVLLKNKLLDFFASFLAIFTKERSPISPVEQKKEEPAVVTPPKKTSQEILKECVMDSLGKDFSTIATDELACAEVFSKVIQGVYPNFPTLISTIAVREHFKVDKRFKPTLDLTPWSVILSVTGQGNGTLAHGHVGFLGENNLIYSNNSFNGRFEQTHTVKEWVDYYRLKGGFPVLIFKFS